MQVGDGGGWEKLGRYEGTGSKEVEKIQGTQTK